MYDAWPWGFSPRLGVVYAVNDDTVVAPERLAHLRVREEHRRELALEGFIGGYNVTAPALPRQLRVQLGRRLAGLAGAAVPRARNTQWQQHPLLATGRLGPASGVLLVDAQPAAAAARPIHRGGGLQRAARAASHDQPAQPESDRPGNLLRLRAAVRGGRRHQSDELAHGFDRWRARPGSRTRMRHSRARSRCGRPCVPTRSTSTSIPAPTAATAAGDRTITRSSCAERSGTPRA